MKKINKKKLIEKKIERKIITLNERDKMKKLSNDEIRRLRRLEGINPNIPSINPNIDKKNNPMNDRDKRRIHGSGKSVLPIDVNLLSKPERDELRRGTYVEKDKNISNYIKKTDVDHDVVICIPSYNRYEKAKRLIYQFYEQSTKYSFKIILLNDGSTDESYERLINQFPEIIYIKNETPNGKYLHWYCYNQMWEYLKNIECHAVLQMDDDFILSDNFLDTMVDLYFELKKYNIDIRGISPHTWSFKNKMIKRESWWNFNNFTDGICLLDIELIKFMNYELEPVDEIVKNPGVPVRAWTQINDGLKKMKGIYYRTPESLVYHDGNEDSKLHGDIRSGGKNGIYTQKITESLKKYINYE